MSCKWVHPVVDAMVNVTRFAVLAWATVRGRRNFGVSGEDERVT